MKVTIDTKEDSHEDIQRALHLLAQIIRNKGPGEHIQRGFSDSPSTKPIEATDTTNQMSMFANPNPAEKKETGPSFGSFLNIANKEEEKKEDPKIEFF